MAVIRIAPCDLDGHGLALVIDKQTELEAKEPAHSSIIPLGQPLEHPVPPDPSVVTDRQLGAIDKVILVFWPRTMEQEVKGWQEPWHQGHKPAFFSWGDQQSSGGTPASGRRSRNV